MSDIQQFKMEDVQKRVADTIKAQFAMMIPDEAFDAMAKTAIEEFFHVEKAFTVAKREKRVPSPNSYHDRVDTWYELATPVTTFKMMLWEEIRKLVEAQLKQRLVEQGAALDAEIKKFFETGSEFQGEVADNVEHLCKIMASSMQTQLLNQANGMIQTTVNQFAAQNNLRLPFSG